jgi:Homeodomain-like domain/DDE superfamily endonuclease
VAGAGDERGADRRAGIYQRGPGPGRAHNFNADGFASLYPRDEGGRPPKLTLAQRRQIKKTAKSAPADHGPPFSAWSLPKLAEFLVAEGVVDDISHEGLRASLREEGVTFSAPEDLEGLQGPALRGEEGPHRALVRDRRWRGGPAAGGAGGDFCVDEFGPLNLQPRPGRQWAAISGKNKEPGRAPRRRLRATYSRTKGVRHLFAAYELGEDKLYGHVKPRKTRARFPQFCRYLRSLYPPAVRIAIICDNFSPHLTTAKDRRAGTWAQASNAEIAHTPTNASWSNRIEAQFTALRYLALDGTGRASHREQAA